MLGRALGLVTTLGSPVVGSALCTAVRESRQPRQTVLRDRDIEPTGHPGTAIAARWRVELPRRVPIAFASPLRSMLALSAATRAVAAADQLEPAIAALEREACRLTGAREATVVTIDWDTSAVWTLDGAVVSDEVRALVTRVAGSGQRELYGHALVEPIGGPLARAVLALRRPAAARFEPDDVALVAALVGAVAATVDRLLGPRARGSRRVE